MCGCWNQHGKTKQNKTAETHLDHETEGVGVNGTITGTVGGGDTALSLLPVGYGTPSEQRIAPMVGWQVAMSQRNR